MVSRGTGEPGHIWVVAVDNDGVHYQAFGEQGEKLDEYYQPARHILRDAPAHAAANN